MNVPMSAVGNGVHVAGSESAAQNAPYSAKAHTGIDSMKIEEAITCRDAVKAAGGDDLGA